MCYPNNGRRRRNGNKERHRRRRCPGTCTGAIYGRAAAAGPINNTAIALGSGEGARGGEASGESITIPPKFSAGDTDPPPRSRNRSPGPTAFPRGPARTCYDGGIAHVIPTRAILACHPPPGPSNSPRGEPVAVRTFYHGNIYKFFFALSLRLPRAAVIHLRDSRAPIGPAGRPRATRGGPVFVRAAAARVRFRLFGDALPCFAVTTFYDFFFFILA